MDPYEVLGVPAGSPLPVVKSAYKELLLKTHPDKLGNSTLFKLVHKAYKEIERSYKTSKQFNNAPKKKVVYQNDLNLEPKRPVTGKKFSNDKFNTFFEKNKIYGDDPFKSGGYSNMMCESLRYAEDVDVMKNKQIKAKKRQMVLYKEPQPINELYTGSYSLLGVNKMSDFSCGNGTDYMKAYTDPEEQIDTVRRYKNVDQLLNDRSSQTFHKTDEEIEYSKQLERQRRRLEQQRISNMTRNEQIINDRYVHLNRRLK